MADNTTVSVSDFCDAMRRSLELEADLLADRKELELQAKASGINVSAAKKWLKAEVQDSASENPKKVAKLIEQTVDQVVYGESLGHDLGMLQNNAKQSEAIVENASKPEPQGHRPIPEATGGEADEVPHASRTASPTPIPFAPAHPSSDAKGGAADSSSPVAPPAHSDFEIQMIDGVAVEQPDDIPAHMRRQHG